MTGRSRDTLLVRLLELKKFSFLFFSKTNFSKQAAREAAAASIEPIEYKSCGVRRSTHFNLTLRVAKFSGFYSRPIHNETRAERGDRVVGVLAGDFIGSTTE